MNVKKAIKRIAALGTGAALMGATVLGAMAADLNNFPSPFVENGQFNAMLVVGESAQTPDIIGAVDIATVLQYEMRTPAAAGGSASEGQTVSVSGDEVKIDLPFNRLTIGESMSNVFDSLSDDDLEALEDGEVDGTEYTQLVELGDASVEFLSEGSSEFYYDEPGWYLQWDINDNIYDYTVEFPTGLTVDDNIEGETIELFGVQYTINEVTNGATFSLKLLGGESSDLIEEFQTKTYVFDGEEYEIEVIYAYEGSARFRVNGEQTDTIDAGDSYELQDGTKLGVKEVLTYNQADRNSLVEFYLGADEMTLEDGQPIMRGTEYIDNTMVNMDTDGTDVLNSFEVQVDAYQEEYGLAAGDNLASWMSETDDTLFGNIDFHYFGNTEPRMSDVEFRESVEDEQYTMRVTTRAGTYTMPIAYNDGSAVNRTGNSKGTFWVAAPSTQDVTAGVWDYDADGEEGWIEQDDTFLLNTDTANAEDTTSRVFTMGSIRQRTSPDRYEISIRDLAGDTSSVTLSHVGNQTGGAESGIYEGETRIGGQTHTFVAIGNDAEAVGLKEQYHEKVVALETGTYLTFGLTDVDDASYTIVHTVPGEMLDDNTDEDWTFTVDTDDGNDAADFEVTTGTSVEVDDDQYYYSDYGMEVVELDTSRESVDVQVPFTQVLPQVYVTSGSVSVNEMAEEATGDSYDVAPVNAGIARLDTDVANTWRNNNVIVVGGPCVNSVAAELLGNPEVCTEGFTQGRAKIKLFEQNDRVAMLVAGRDAADTTRAAAVVNKYWNYPGFSGSEVEVSGTSMSDISVTSVE